MPAPDTTTSTPASWGDPQPAPSGAPGTVVYGYRIRGTRTWVFEAWEPDGWQGPSSWRRAGASAPGPHGTIRHFGGLGGTGNGAYGSVASGPIPDLPSVQERLEAVSALRRASVLLVRATRPDVARLLDAGRGRIVGGAVEVDVDSTDG